CFMIVLVTCLGSFALIIFFSNRKGSRNLLQELCNPTQAIVSQSLVSMK
uniref:Uncharacterized protein n=1 Tax=Salvator merianae TaxID=96440 RepID=A0A8D0BKV4_SALMN